jgi:hypothetical protein
MLSWYYGMAKKNMHAVEQSITGTIYNKAQYWGLFGGHSTVKPCCEKD